MCEREDWLRELYYDWIDCINNMRYNNTITRAKKKEMIAALDKIAEWMETTDYRTMQKDIYDILLAK